MAPESEMANEKSARELVRELFWSVPGDALARKKEDERVQLVLEWGAK